MSKILVIGSTGMLGKPVTSELINAGFDITLLARNTEKVRSIFPGTKLTEGDVFDKQSLANAMKGQDIVYINLSVLQHSTQKNTQPEREGVDNIIAAAKETGVKRLSYLSSLIKNYRGMNGFSWWAFDIKQTAVDKIKKSGIPCTIFYPSTFMETFPYQMMRGDLIMMVGKSVAPMWFIAAKDYAKQVVNALKREDDKSYEYNVQGQEPFTFHEAAKVITGNYDKSKLRTVKVPIGVIKFAGIFAPMLNYGANICEALNKYPEKFVSEKTWADLGKPEITLADFAKGL